MCGCAESRNGAGSNRSKQRGRMHSENIEAGYAPPPHFPPPSPYWASALPHWARALPHSSPPPPNPASCCARRFNTHAFAWARTYMCARPMSPSPNVTHGGAPPHICHSSDKNVPVKTCVRLAHLFMLRISTCRCAVPCCSPCTCGPTRPGCAPPRPEAPRWPRRAA